MRRLMRRMATLLVVLTLLGQDAYPEQVDRCLEEVMAGARSRDFLKTGARRLRGLGEDAIPALADRLAEELRQGTWSDLTDLLRVALVDHPEATTPLQSVFRESSLSIDVRIHLAIVLNSLGDRSSWKREMLGIVRNELLPMRTRICAADLFPNEDEELRDEFVMIVERLPFSSASDQRAVIQFMSTAGNGMRDLMGELMRDRRLSPDIRLHSIEVRLRSGDGAHYAAMFDVLDEIRAGKSRAAPAAEALAVNLASHRPVQEEPRPRDLRPLAWFAVISTLGGVFVATWALRKPSA